MLTESAVPADEVSLPKTANKWGGRRHRNGENAVIDNFERTILNCMFCLFLMIAHGITAQSVVYQ